MKRWWHTCGVEVTFLQCQGSLWFVAFLWSQSRCLQCRSRSWTRLFVEFKIPYTVLCFPVSCSRSVTSRPPIYCYFHDKYSSKRLSLVLPIQTFTDRIRCSPSTESTPFPPCSKSKNNVPLSMFSRTVVLC